MPIQGRGKLWFVFEKFEKFSFSSRFNIQTLHGEEESGFIIESHTL